MSAVAVRDQQITWNRAHRAPSIEEMFGRQHTPEAEMPDPAPLVSNMALAVVEILAGIRSPEQVARWVDTNTMNRLVIVHGRMNRRHTHGAGALKRSLFTLLRTRVTSPRAGIIEASAVVTDQRRARAVTMRLEALDYRWRITQLHVV